jgi:uncharacterized protein
MTTIFGESHVVTVHKRKLIPLSPENQYAAERHMIFANEAMRPHFKDWAKRLTKLINDYRKPVRPRFRSLYQIADEMTAAAAPYSPCKRGCSACCHMATLISEPEAEMMAAALRIKIHKPKTWPFFDLKTGVAHEYRDQFSETFFGYEKPCTFLVNNECSIYEHRPLACRVHLNMGANAEPCQMDAGRETAMLNLLKLDEAYAMIGMTARMHDIREYFPKEPR